MGYTFFSLTGAIAAEKLEGTSRGVNADPPSFFLRYLPLLLQPCLIRSLSHSSFPPLPLNPVKRFGEAL